MLRRVSQRLLSFLWNDLLVPIQIPERYNWTVEVMLCIILSSTEYCREVIPHWRLLLTLSLSEITSFVKNRMAVEKSEPLYLLMELWRCTTSLVKLPIESLANVWWKCLMLREESWRLQRRCERICCWAKKHYLLLTVWILQMCSNAVE